MRWLFFTFWVGCGTDKIYLDTGLISGASSSSEAGPANRVDTGPTDTGDPRPEDEDSDGYTIEDGDCDDTDAAINPGAEETCNGLDDDCDGAVDEDLELLTWYADADGDGVGAEGMTQTACEAPEGTVASPGDCDDSDPSTYPDAEEICDGTDNDCDALIDEDVTTRFYRDLDGDGYGSPFDVQDACESPAGFAAVGTDCDDTDPSVNPGGTEVCNEIDDDCDGFIDEDVGTATWYADEDGDGYGSEAITGSTCAGIPYGYVWEDGDCDDSDPLTFPDAGERCDGVDNDCDGEIDEDGTSVWYADVDGDGHGDAASVVIGCDAPSGYVSTPFDCDDASDSVYPGASEVCNEVDDDCDLEVDESAADAPTWYQDFDGDGYGNPGALLANCTMPSGYVSDATDCNDINPDIHPGADEVCNEIDDDCNGLIDTEDDGLLGGAAYYFDGDADGYGLTTTETYACEEPSGFTDLPGDCDDDDSEVNPDGVETCDGLDNDCDGIVDPGALDSDGDGIANCVDETVYLQDFSSGEWDDWSSWYIGGNEPNWTLTGRYLMEQSNAANAIAYSPYLGTLDEFTLSVDIMQGGGANHGCGIAYAVEEGDEVLLVEWRDPTHYYGWWWYPGAIIIYELRSGTWVALDSVSTTIDLSRDYFEWVTMSVTVSGSLIQVYMDDELVLAHAYAGDLNGPGRVGVWTWDNDGGVYFDDVAVTQPPP